MQPRPAAGSSRVHPSLEVRHSTLSRGTIEDIQMDQVDLAQASSLYGRQHIEAKNFPRELQHPTLQSRISGLSELHVPYQMTNGSRSSRGVWQDHQKRRNKSRISGLSELHVPYQMTNGSRSSRGVWQDHQKRRNKYIEELQLYTRQHFHQKECSLFVPVPNQKVPKVRNLKCHCGEVLMEHAGMRNSDANAPAKVGNVFLETLYLIPKELRPYISSHKLDEEPSTRMPNIMWSKENIRTTVTGTYGKIDFVNVEHHGGKKPAKFVRISNEDSVDDLMTLMIEHWKIMEPQAPNLVISVVGGAKNFKLDGRMRDTFSTGLIKTAKTTSAWLITSGFNMGVMKAVGQAVRQGQSFCWDNERMAHVLRCIGIAPWGYVMDRKKLESEDGMGSFNVDFRMSNAILHGQPVPLNADHTHFIFVDDGYRNRYGGVADFRSKFEQKVFKQQKDGGLGIPVVLVVVEGGTDAIIDAKSSLEHDIPVVICSGTGRAADIIAYAYSHTKAVSGGTKEMTQKHLNKLREKIFDAYGKAWKEHEKEKKIDGILENVMICCEKSNLITVFDMNKQEDLDIAILSALLKATTGASQDQRLKQLKLAITWNRVDIAQEEIFREDVLWKPGSLYDTLTDAILTDKIKFIELILQQGSVIMKEYLTSARLQELYMKVPKYHFIYRLMFKLTRRDQLTRENLHLLLCKLLDRFVDDSDDRYTNDVDYDDMNMEEEEECELLPQQEVFKRPYKHLMIWAVLLHRQDLAKFCWEMGDEPVTSAIAMTRLYDAIARHIGRNESELRDKIYMYKDEFENLATSVLNECHLKDPEKAMMIVERRSPAWNEMTCLQIASAANDQIFTASEACMNSVDTIWRSGIMSRWVKVLLAVFCPLVSVFSMEFVEGKKNLTWYEKLATFFTAPTTKFLYRMFLYILFIILHSFMVLVDFNADKITPLEMVCNIWILSFITDKLHTLVAFPSPTLKSKFRDVFGFMDWIEVMNYALCFVGFVTHVAGYPRVTKVFYCINSVFFVISLTKYYIASPILGPKLIMITRMLKQLIMFLIVLVVFLLAYGVSSQGLLYKERNPNWVILKDVVYFPYWQLYGELFHEEIETDDSCTAGDRDCRTFHWLVPILLGLYLLLGNILLLTLLIAIFSNVFDNVEKNAQTISKFYMYFLVMEYDVKVFLAPPLCLIQHVILTIAWLFKHTCCETEKEKQTLGKRHLEYLQLFEKEMMTNMLRQRKEEDLVSLETTVTSLQKRVDDLTRLIEDEVIADAHTGQASTPFTLSRDPTMLDRRQESIASMSTNLSQAWPTAQEVISVRDKVMNTTIPPDYFTRSIPPLKKSDSAALLVLPSDEGSKSFMTIPVTLSGEPAGDSTKIMVQELRRSQKDTDNNQQEEDKLNQSAPARVENKVDQSETGREETQNQSGTDKKAWEPDNENDKQNKEPEGDDSAINTSLKRERRRSSKKRKRDREGKTEENGEVNNVNRPHSSIERGSQRVHFLLPDDEGALTRPKTAGLPGSVLGRYTDIDAGRGKIDITDLDVVYGNDDTVPLTAWVDDQQNIHSHMTVQQDPEPIVYDETDSKDKKKNKKKKKKKKKNDSGEVEESD